MKVKNTFIVRINLGNYFSTLFETEDGQWYMYIRMVIYFKDSPARLTKIEEKEALWYIEQTLK